MMILSRVSTKDLHFLPPCHYNTHQKDAPISKKPVSGGHARFCGRRIDMKVLTKRIIMSISGVVLCGMSVGIQARRLWRGSVSEPDERTGPADSDSLRNTVCDR